MELLEHYISNANAKLLLQIISQTMIATAPTPESVFRAQYQYMAQAYMQYHAYQVKKCFAQIPQEESCSCTNSDLSMVTRVGIESYLTNPYFAIEGCLNSL